MISSALLFALGLFVCCNAQCYDRNTRQSYRAGERYNKSKPLGDLMGLYSCQCYPGGMMRCSAVDIPCRDSVSQKYVDAHERFNIYGRRGEPYNCICRRGRGRYDTCFLGHLSGRCRGINGEEADDGESFVVEKYGAGVRCRCQDGRAEPGSCQKVCLDHVTREVADEGEEFTYFSFGSLYTCTCHGGLPRSCTSKTQEIDACAFGQDNCDRPRATCTSQGYSFTCECKAGYQGDGRRCTDVDECLGAHRCDENAACVNTEGSYSCSCNDGYTGDGYVCIREFSDSCDRYAVFCDVNARCEPTEDSYLCICNEGYTGSGTECQDIDECTAVHGCDANASCNNTQGSYLCFCNYGYSGDGRRCLQMCKDEATGAYVRQHDVFVKVRDGRRQACTCGENGEEIESSCYGGDVEEETEYPTEDAAPIRGPFCKRGGRRYGQGDTYEMIARRRKYICTCTQRRGSAISRCRPT